MGLRGAVLMCALWAASVAARPVYTRSGGVVTMKEWSLNEIRWDSYRGAREYMTTHVVGLTGPLGGTGVLWSKVEGTPRSMDENDPTVERGLGYAAMWPEDVYPGNVEDYFGHWGIWKMEDCEFPRSAPLGEEGEGFATVARTRDTVSNSSAPNSGFRLVIQRFDGTTFLDPIWVLERGQALGQPNIIATSPTTFVVVAAWQVPGYPHLSGLFAIGYIYKWGGKLILDYRRRIAPFNGETGFPEDPWWSPAPPYAAPAKNGEYLVSWIHRTEIDGVDTIYSQRVGPLGNLIGGHTRISGSPATKGLRFILNMNLITLQDGSHVYFKVLHERKYINRIANDVYAYRYADDGRFLGEAHLSPGGFVKNFGVISASPRPGGGFLAAWADQTPGSFWFASTIFVQGFSNDLIPDGPKIQVPDDPNPGDWRNVGASVGVDLSTGSFVVAWISQQYTLNTILRPFRVKAQYFNSDECDHCTRIPSCRWLEGCYLASDPIGYPKCRWGKIKLQRPCDDGNPITTNDRCRESGTCYGDDLCRNVDCKSEACKQSTCDPNTGACVVADKDHGTPCNDNNPSTVRDICTKGQCVGEDLCSKVNCAAPDPCVVASCVPATGACSTKQLDDKAPCTGPAGPGTCWKGACRAQKTVP